MAQNETWLNHDLLNAVQVQYLDGNLFSQDNAGNLIGINLFRDGVPYSGGGSVSANVIRADGGTVSVVGALSGNVATVVLPQAAYAVPGVVSIVVKLTVSGQVTTIAAVVANVYQSSTDSAIDPGTIIPSVQTLIAAIDAAVASIPADYSALWTSLAPAFSSSVNYTAGQYVTYNGALYRFTTDHASGAWNSAHVMATNIGSDLNSLKSAINSIYSDSISVTQGYWAIANGIPTNSDYWCKTNEFVDKKLILETNYKMFLLAFNKNTGEYIGTWDGSTFSTTYNSGSYLNYINVREWTNNYPNYQFKIDFQKPGGTVVTPNDVYSNISVKDVENNTDKNIDYINAKTNIIGNTLYNTFIPFVLWENGQLTNGKPVNGKKNQRTSNFICVDGIDLSDVIVSCDASGIYTYISQYDAGKNFLSSIHRDGIGTISPTNPSTKYVKIYTYSETVSQDQQSSHITISFINFDSNAKKINNNYFQSVIELTQSMVYENGEVGASGNSYDMYPTNNRTDRARAKKEYIQKIPDGATSFTVWIDEGAFASGRYKLGWAQYTSEYSQISATIKGWYTTKTSFTDNVNENAKYFMFYFATVSPNDTVDVATLPLDCCHVEFNNISIDYAKQLMNPSMITLYPQIDERISNLETNEALQTGGVPFVYSINHRGYSDEAPENTIPAYILSKKKGFSYAECDVQFTSDGVAVLLHDSTINRTGRNADGTSISSTIDIGDITYEQALTYDFGIWKGAIWAGTKIPTFEQFIVACKKLSLHPVVELKDVVNGTYWTDARIAVIANVIKKLGMEENVSFISFAKSALEKISAIFPKAMIGLGLEGEYTEANFNTFVQNAESLLSDNHVVAATVNYTSMTDALYLQLTNAGIHPIAWTVNTESAVLALNASVIGILSDSVNAGEIYLKNMLSQM